MNWKLIFQLSIFGLVMAFATVSLIPEQVELLFWLIIFAVCAYIFAKAGTGKYFLHGFILSLFNCVWIIIAHVIFYNSYVLNHPDMAKMGNNMPLTTHPRLLMVITGPIFGAIFGLIQGLFFYIASKIIKKKAAPVKA